MKAHLIDTHLLVPMSRSSANIKVKYQGHVSQKMGVLGGISVSQTHLVFLAYMYVYFPPLCYCSVFQDKVLEVFYISQSAC